jgi:hypothetical protein
MKKILTFSLLLIGAVLLSQTDSVNVASSSTTIVNSSATYKQLILGDIDSKQYVVFILFGYIGMILNTFGNIWSRDKSDENNKKLSGKKFFKNDWKKLIVSIILVPVAILFAQEMFDIVPTNFTCMLIGGFSDSLAMKLKRKGFLAVEKVDIGENGENANGGQSPVIKS